MKKVRIGVTTVLVSLGVMVAGAACQKEAPPPAPAPAPAPAAAAPAAGSSDGAAAAAPAADGAATVKAGTATLKGVVKLSGTPPEMALTKRQADPYCARTPMKDEEVMVGPGGGLRNVLVRITTGTSGNYEAPMTNATLDQSACMYRPRVQAIMAGQSLLIRNSDQTLHNVHTYRGASTLFNQAEIPGLPPIAKKFDQNGDLLKFKCDVHPWMTAYVAVSNHPFFAVTGDDGTFEIPKVPAGTYTLQAWHERYGTKSAQVTVQAGTPAVVSFKFDAK
jgi:plastocyanin